MQGSLVFVNSFLITPFPSVLQRQRGCPPTPYLLVHFLNACNSCGTRAGSQYPVQVSLTCVAETQAQASAPSSRVCLRRKLKLGAQAGN